MLQATEYQSHAYWLWFWRSHDFDRIMHRRTLVMTAKARLLLSVMQLGMLAEFAGSAVWFVYSIQHNQPVAYLLSLVLFLATPLVWAHLILLPLLAGDWLLTKPYVWLMVQRSKYIFGRHPAVKIAVAGSYGKTTMKEMLAQVLGGVKNVGATPATKNVAVSHARFASGLRGDEEVLIIEFGEGKPGDIARFAHVVKPTAGIITGVAPMHLDKYKSLQAAGEDIFSLARFVDPKSLYVNAESSAARDFIKPSFKTYDSRHAADWKISDVKSSINGVEFVMSRKTEKMHIKSKQLGEHQAGPLAMVAALAHKLGLSAEQIEKAIAGIEPFEHRMAPRKVGGAWLIDDTYNGNIEGMEAGLKLLMGLPAKRKLYVTPGLVDQGRETKSVHHRLGRAIADACPDVTVLMKHSVTDDIIAGLSRHGYRGELIIETDPLNFYNNLDQFIAAGDLCLMQNDWPDNYN